MSQEIYIAGLKNDFGLNPLENTNYKKILGLLPTLEFEIQKKVLELLDPKYNILNKNDLSDNFNIISEYLINKEKEKLIGNLHILKKITKHKNIRILTDDCFTNSLLIDVIKDILGDNYFNEFIDIENIDLSQNISDNNLGLDSNILTIIGGSLNDTYTINESYYDGKLASSIKDVLDDSNIKSNNNRILGVCFGQQYLANLLGIKNNDSSSVIATYKGLAQFGPSNCSIYDTKYINNNYRNALNGLSDNGTNSLFSTFFTRTGHVDFDLLKTNREKSIVPLIEDKITGNIVGWGSKNGNVLGVQFHPEISFTKNREFLEKNILEILPYLNNYKDFSKILENFDFDKNMDSAKIRDISKAFYTFVLSSFVESIVDNLSQKIELINNKKEELFESSYEKSLSIITSSIRERVDSILSSNQGFNNKKERLSFLNKIDECGKLLLNNRLDWKVNRGIKEVSNVLGFKDLGLFFEKHIDFLKNIEKQDRVYFFRDWGAGDGSLLKDMYSKYKGKDIIFYGVGDYVYFDIFPSLKNKGLELGIPNDVIILFFEDFLENYKKISGEKVLDKVTEVIKNTSISKIHKIHNSSITGEDTKMFSLENEYDLSKDSIEFIKNNKYKIEELKSYILENFYDLFEGYFERIYVSKFNDFEFSSNLFSSVDFQIAIRSTSHIDTGEYKKVIDEYIRKNANPGSIYIDNGVHRSYTSLPRIPELYEIFKDNKNFNISLIYDTNTNYYTGVIINKLPFLDKNEIKQNLSSSYILVSLEEANQSIYTKMEYFIRSFIVGNFKNYSVFWNYNKIIINTLNLIVSDLKEAKKDNIKKYILNLINFIASDFKYDKIEYNNINIEILEGYKINGVTIDNILDEEIFIPEWLNLNKLRNN